MAIITGNSLDNNLQGTTDADELYGQEGNDTLLGGEGNDTIWSGVGDDILNGGLGNDVLYGEGANTNYVFDANFGVDQIDTGNSGIHIIQFTAAQKSEATFYRQRHDLFVHVGSDWLQIKDYFESDADVKIAFQDTDPLQPNTETDIRALIMQGTPNDSFVGFYAEPNATLTGGAGDDLLAFNQNGANTHVVIDGGTGNDWFQSQATETDIIFGKNSDHDAVSISQYDAIVNIVINDPTLSVGDVYMANEGAQLYLAIRNSTARLDIEDPSSLINGTNTTWQVKVNAESVDLSTLFTQRDISNDGVVFLAGGSSFTSSVADETIIVATSTSPLSVITLNTGFGHDALLNSAHVVFDGAQSDYTVSRVGGLLEIKHNNTGDILTSNLNSSESVFEFSGGVILSTEQILQMLVSTTETIYLTPGQTHINTDADINQMFYADQASSNESIVLNAGGNYNTISVGQNTTIAHDVLNNGKDTLEMPALIAMVGANTSKIKILNVADVSKLSVDIATNGDVTIHYDNGMGNYSEIKGGAGLNTASLIGVEFYSDLGDTLISTFEDTFLGKLANHSEHILAMPEGTSVPPGFTFAMATSAGQVIARLFPLLVLLGDLMVLVEVIAIVAEGVMTPLSLVV